jgi:hypothetical protein
VGIAEMKLTVALQLCLLNGLNLVMGQAAEQIDSGFLVKEWERKSAAVESLQVVWLRFVSRPEDGLGSGKEPTKDAPPIVPSLNKMAFTLLIYHRAGAKEHVGQWMFDQNALTYQARDHLGPGEGPRPYIPFIVRDFPTQQVYEGLKTGEATVSLTREPSGAKQKVMLTTLWSSVEGKPPSARITALLDSALGYAPIECRVMLLFPDGGESLAEVHRWSRHVELLKDLWLPQEHEINVFSPEGKVRGRNKNIILSCLVNCRVPDSVFE